MEHNPGWSDYGPVNRGGNLGAGKGQTGHFLACCEESFI